MKIFIKYMASLRCRLMVASELNKMGIQHLTMDQGLVEIHGALNEKQRLELRTALRKKGLEVLDESLSGLIERTTNVVMDMVRQLDKLPNIKTAQYVGKAISYDPLQLTDMFAEVKGISLEQFVINHKIEYVKELLLYDQLSIEEISKKLGYENADRLVYQFKKSTGLTPSYFKSMRKIRMMASNGMLTKNSPSIQ
jgi:YesN/AraC family two-component response regulator